MHPDWYVRRHHVRCSCGGEFRPDVYRNARELKQRTTCYNTVDCWWFPHQRGCRGCIHGPDFNEESGEYYGKTYDPGAA